MLLNINRQPDSNTVQVADEVHAQVEEIRKSLPPGIEIKPFYDQSIIVSDSIKSVRDAILHRPDSGFHHSGGLSARLGHFDRGRAGDSGHQCW